MLCATSARPDARQRSDLFCLVKKIKVNEIRRKNSFLSGKLSSAYLKADFGRELSLIAVESRVEYLVRGAPPGEEEPCIVVAWFR